MYTVLFADLLTIPEPRPVGIKSKTPLKNDDNKYMTRVVRFNNNFFSELTKFRTVLDSIIADPMLISWIDLSFNTLSKIDEVSELYVNLPAKENQCYLSYSWDSRLRMNSIFCNFSSAAASVTILGSENWQSIPFQNLLSASHPLKARLH